LQRNWIKNAIQQIVLVSKQGINPVSDKKFAKIVEKTIDQIDLYLSKDHYRWHAIKILERDEEIIKKLQLPSTALSQIEQCISDLEKKMDNDSESIITQERYCYIESICDDTLYKSKIPASNISDKIDHIVTNRWLSLPLFFLIMCGIYYISIQTIGAMTIEWVDYLFSEIIGSNIAVFLQNAGASAWAHGLVLEGIVAGVGSVLTFVPQIMILFMFLSLLEDCGYMGRVAFIMDRLFRNFGLSGKSFVPMLIGSGCSVPAIMASRTVDNERDRKLTIILTPFIPCSAKLPVFTLFVGTFFPHATWVGASMYFIGIIMVIVSGILLKRTKVFEGKIFSFVMELPPYRMPTIKGVWIHMWERAKTFIIKAGTIIFSASIIIWVLQNFNWHFDMVESSDSILASIGHVVAPLFAPLGFSNWQSAVALLTGFLAKENVVATFGILFNLSDLSENNVHMINNINQLFSPLSAYAFMVFTLLSAPSFAAIGAIKREMGSWKWTLIAIGYQTGAAYLVALLIYQIGSLFV
jgi:ferrous iron transport protein B